MSNLISFFSYGIHKRHVSLIILSGVGSIESLTTSIMPE